MDGMTKIKTDEIPCYLAKVVQAALLNLDCFCAFVLLLDPEFAGPGADLS